jgi:hypothetical protein
MRGAAPWQTFTNGGRTEIVQLPPRMRAEAIQFFTVNHSTRTSINSNILMIIRSSQRAAE